MASTQTTATTSSSSSTSSTAGSHRSCPNCKKRMSILKYDHHSICLSCRDTKCDFQNRCKECKDWNDSLMSEYLKHRKSLDQKGGKSGSSSAGSSGSSSGSSSSSRDKEKFKEMEDKISSSLSAKFDDFSKQLLGLVADRNVNPSFSAPLQVPEQGHLSGPAGGEASFKSTYCGGVSKSPGAGLASNLDPPHVHNVSLVNVNASSSGNVDYVTSEIMLDRSLGKDFEWQGAQGVSDSGDRLQGRSPLFNFRNKVNAMPNVPVIPPATFSPDLIFPSFNPPPPSSSAESLATASSSASSSSSSFSVPSFSKSPSPFPSHAPVAKEDMVNIYARNLGLSQGYVDLVKGYVDYGYDPKQFYAYMCRVWPGAMDDVGKDFQGGESLLVKVILSGKRSASQVLGGSQWGSSGVVPSFPGAQVPPPVPVSTPFSFSSSSSSPFLPCSSAPSGSSASFPTPNISFSFSSAPQASPSFSGSSQGPPASFPVPASPSGVVPPQGPLPAHVSGFRPPLSAPSSSFSGLSSASGVTGSLQTPFSLPFSSAGPLGSLPGLPSGSGSFPIGVGQASGSLASSIAGVAPQQVYPQSEFLFPHRPSLVTVSAASSVRPAPGLAAPVVAQFPPPAPSGSDYIPLGSVGVSSSTLPPQSSVASSSSSFPAYGFPQGFAHSAFVPPQSGPMDDVDSVDGREDDLRSTDSQALDQASSSQGKPSEYRRMMEFITSMYPQALGDSGQAAKQRSLFETIFSQPPPTTSPTPSFVWFERLLSLFNESDDRLASQVKAGKASTRLLPGRKNIYSVSGNPSSGRSVPLNESLEVLLDRSPSLTRMLGMNIREGMKVESALRNHLEALSHTMWVLSGFVGFLKRDGYNPSDQTLFDAMTFSLSAGLLDQAHISSSLLNFICLKRREFFVGQLPPYFPELQKRALLAAPVTSLGSLFREEDIAAMLEVAQTCNTLRSQQAVLDAAASNARSPVRKPALKRKGSPSRSPKKVKFSRYSSSSSSPSAASSSSSSRSPRKNFHK